MPLILAAELVAGQNAPFHVPHLHDPVTLGSGCQANGLTDDR